MVEAGVVVVRWKHTLYDWLKVSKVELAVIAELLLRGPQTEGDLRSRAAEWNRSPTCLQLQSVLEALASRDLVVNLSPPGQKRGVMVTHGLYPPQELEKVRVAFASARRLPETKPNAPYGSRPSARNLLPPPGWPKRRRSCRDRHPQKNGRGPGGRDPRPENRTRSLIV